MTRSERFSRRHGLARQYEGPLVYDDAPEAVRVGFLTILREEFGLSLNEILEFVCQLLRIRPQGNWSHDWIQSELDGLVFRAEWYKFFDIVEAFSEHRSIPAGDRYDNAINQLFEEEGIGWQLQGGEFEIRGDEPLEKVVEDAFSQLEASGLEVASQELSEAWHDLSRRPEPDLSGAVHHAMAALEAVAREWSGDRKLTLGEIIKKHSDMFPKPLDDAAAKLWGFASEQARHGREETGTRPR